MAELLSNVRNYEGRWHHLYKLWNLAISNEFLPQMDKWLVREFAKNSNYGSRDRRWYSEWVFAGIRFGYFAIFCEEFYQFYKNIGINNDKNCLFLNFIEDFGKKYNSSEDLINAFRLMNEERFFIWIRFRYVNSNVRTQDNNFFETSQDSYLPEKVFYNNILDSLKSEEFLLSNMLFQSIPLCYYDFFKKRIFISGWSQTQQEKFFNFLEVRPPMWLRLNDDKYLKNVFDELTLKGYKIEIYNKYALKVLENKGGLFDTKTFRSGLFEIQDLASQQIGNFVKAKVGQFVWDCCSGGGGKTQQIASLLKNKGVIYASDIREYKLEEVKKRAAKSGFFNIRCLPWNGENLPNFQIEITKNNGFDWVLIDAPCSSSGTWRRNPDSKYRMNKNSLFILNKLQLNIIKAASQAVKIGGYLVYSTCSFIFEENEGVVEDFLASHNNFSLIEQHILGSPFENSDTMFVAVMKKKIIEY